MHHCGPWWLWKKLVSWYSYSPFRVIISLSPGMCIMRRAKLMMSNSFLIWLLRLELRSQRLTWIMSTLQVNLYSTLRSIISTFPGTSNGAALTYQILINTGADRPFKRWLLIMVVNWVSKHFLVSSWMNEKMLEVRSYNIFLTWKLIRKVHHWFNSNNSINSEHSRWYPPW